LPELLGVTFAEAQRLTGEARRDVLSQLTIIGAELRRTNPPLAQEVIAALALLLRGSLIRLANKYDADSGEVMFALLAAVDHRAKVLVTEVWYRIRNAHRSDRITEELTREPAAPTEERDVLLSELLEAALSRLQNGDRELALRAWVLEEPQDVLAAEWDLTPGYLRIKLSRIKNRLKSFLIEGDNNNRTE
jgi:hypothetical protein